MSNELQSHSATAFIDKMDSTAALQNQVIEMPAAKPEDNEFNPRVPNGRKEEIL